MKIRTGWGVVGWALHQTGARELGAGLLQRVGRLPGAEQLGSCEGGGFQVGGRQAQDCSVGWGCSPWGLGKGRRGLQRVLVKVFTARSSERSPALWRLPILRGECSLGGQFQAADIERGSGRVVSLLQDTSASQVLCFDKGGWRLAWGRPA